MKLHELNSITKRVFCKQAQTTGNFFNLALHIGSALAQQSRKARNVVNDKSRVGFLRWAKTFFHAEM